MYTEQVIDPRFRSTSKGLWIEIHSRENTNECPHQSGIITAIKSFLEKYALCIWTQQQSTLVASPYKILAMCLGIDTTSKEAQYS